MLNKDYFKTWTPTMAYILGFIVADGSIRHKDYCKTDGYSLVICIHEKDSEIIEFIHKELNCTSNIYHRIYTGNDGITRENCSIVATSQVLVQDLMRLGVVPQKTGKEIMPPNIPKKYFPDFFRGYFDGDGCIRVYQQNVKGWIGPAYSCSLTCANKEFLECLKNGLGGLGGAVRNHGKKNDTNPSCYRWNAGSKKQIIEIGELIYYEGHQFALNRKREKFHQIMESE